MSALSEAKQYPKPLTLPAAPLSYIEDTAWEEIKKGGVDLPETLDQLSFEALSEKRQELRASVADANQVLEGLKRGNEHIENAHLVLEKFQRQKERDALHGQIADSLTLLPEEIQHAHEIAIAAKKSGELFDDAANSSYLKLCSAQLETVRHQQAERIKLSQVENLCREREADLLAEKIDEVLGDPEVSRLQQKLGPRFEAILKDSEHFFITSSGDVRSLKGVSKVLLSAMASAGSIGISLATATGGDPRATLIAAAGAVAAALFSVSTHTRNEERIAVAQAVINASKKIIPDPLSEGFYPLLLACAANKEQASQIVQVYKNRLRKNATDF